MEYKFNRNSMLYDKSRCSYANMQYMRNGIDNNKNIKIHKTYNILKLNIFL